jgi:4-amino-4-deoxy-L-arabinose transferase-like glycosyltransferase
MLLCGLTFFVGLGRPAITDSDEAFYAEAAREMVDGDDWITPRYNDEYRFEKPVLYYWLAALGYLAVGVGEGAARFPSALAGLVLVLTTFACARRWYDERTALLAGAITATSFGYVAVARQALPDLVLAAFISLATWTAFEALVARVGRRVLAPPGCPASPATWRC